MKLKITTALMIMALFGAACSTTQTLSESGQRFDFKKDTGITVGKTTKREVYETYGQPSMTNVMGKYEILVYSYSRDTFKTMGVGGVLLRAVPGVGEAVLISDMTRDHGKEQLENSGREWQDLEFYVDLGTGIVRDYFYHDSELNGQDESETLYLKAMAALQKKKDDEAVKMLERAVELNPANHRASNNLAWRLIDLGIDVNKGITLAEKAVQSFPESPYNNGTLGVGYYKKGDLANAEKYLQAAVNLFPIYAPDDGISFQHDQAMLATIRGQKPSAN